MNKLEFTRFPALEYSGTEALNTLCTNLTFAGENIKRIMITSCQGSEGKSFMSMNLMRAFAKLGKKVVLVDTDLRKSVISGRYGVQMDPKDGKGLTHYLVGRCSASDILYETNIPNAYMVPVGHEVYNSLSLLTGPRLGNLLDDLAQRFDFVLVDAPPVGVIIDAAQIAKSCDGTLFVVSYNRVRRRELLEAKKQIERTGCPIIGSVLNDVTFDSLSAKRYYYKSYYNSHYAYGYYNNSPAPNAQQKKPQPGREHPNG